MPIVDHAPLPLLPDAFRADRHAARYLGVLEADPDAFAHLLRILNDPVNERRLQDASERGEAALRGIVREVEADPALLAAVVDERTGPRLRQAVGVAVRLKMERLGWSTTGRKGPAGGDHFTRAEKYARAEGAAGPGTSALAALDRVASIGSEDERRATGDHLLAALRATRAEQGRPF